MRSILAIDVFRAGNQPGGIDFQLAHARTRHEPHAALDQLRPVRDVHRTFGALNAAPHTSGALLTRIERTVRARGDGIWRGPPMPTEVIVGARDAAAHPREGRWRQRRTFAGRKGGIA